MFVSPIGPAINTQESQSILRPALPLSGNVDNARGVGVTSGVGKAEGTLPAKETGAMTPTASTGFSDLLREVVARENFAQNSVEQYATGASQNIHETMVALEKADVTLSLLVNVRNKLMDAYKEVMRMT